MVGLGLGFGRDPVHGHALDSALDLNALYLPPMNPAMASEKCNVPDTHGVILH